MSKEKDKNFELNFRVTHGNVENTFEAMKKYQEMGIADKKSNIIFNGVVVPAGYFDSFEDFFEVYTAIISSDFPTIEKIMGSLEEADVSHFEAICFSEIEKYNNNDGTARLRR